jgi:hypothetical protein
MDYSVGSHVRVKLYGGKIIEAKITAIVNQSAGRKIRISFGKEKCCNQAARGASD